ncbi:MAG: hypothetical protein MUC99_03650 [Anaerolineae bacterium]|jgi:HEAT repeat protein|nr:hypothetical protein [Anaerolineae bacterium]
MASNQKRIFNYLMGRLDDLLWQEDEISKAATLQIIADFGELNDPDFLPVIQSLLEDREKRARLDAETVKALQQVGKLLFTAHRPKP